VTAYSLSKAAVTHLLQTLHRTHRCPAVVLRPSLAYGPGQGNDMFLPDLIRTLLAGRRFTMSEGDQTRDYVYIDDLIEAILLASARPAAMGQVINISSGVPVPLKDVARLAARKIGPDAEGLLDLGSKDYRPNEIMEYVASHRLAEELLGWRPHTPLDDGLTTTVEYFRERVAAQ
jgi:UDP-glucose 4-epimerase